MLTWKQNRDETRIVQDSNETFNRRRQENELCVRWQLTKTTKHRNEKKKNSAQCNRYKQSKKKEWTGH